MTLKEFYPEGFAEPISDEGRTILLIKPDRDYDPTSQLKELFLDRREVAFTWPKGGIDLLMEVKLYGAKFNLQIGKLLTRKLPFFSVYDDSLEESLFNAVTDKIVNYHHHDEYSMKDAIGTVGKFQKETKSWSGLAGLLLAQKSKFMSITNHGSIGGWIKQGNACKETGLKCLYGMEAYYSNYRGDDPEEKKKNRSACHLILIAQTLEGYYNLIRIHNDASLNGFYYTPRTCDESLQKWGKGLVATSACFLPGTNVFMRDGIQEIEKINNKDVLTHTSSFRNAVPTRRTYTGDMKTIKCRGLVTTTTSTNDHRYLVVKKKNQKKSNSRLLNKELVYDGVSPEAILSRRRDFEAEWTSHIEKGDWLLFPSEKNTASVPILNLSKYNQGNSLSHRLIVSQEGRSLLRDARKVSLKTLKTLKEEGSWSKAHLYCIENKNSNPFRMRLLKHLKSIGMNGEDFIVNHCREVFSQDCGLIKNYLPESVVPDEQLLFLLGAYCAEGSSGKHTVLFTLNCKEESFANEIISSLKSLGLSGVWKTDLKHHKGDVIVGSLALKLFLEDVCGKLAVNKHVPPFVFDLPFSLQKCFLRGYLLGDGYRGKPNSRTSGYVSSSSVSESMSIGVARLLLRGGFYPSCQIKKQHTDKNGILHQDVYTVQVSGKQHRVLSNYVWKNIGDCVVPNSLKVRNNIPIVAGGIEYYTSLVTHTEYYHVENAEVHCLTVEGDQSFITGFAVVHNCAAGELAKLVMEDRWEEAEARYHFYNSCFDKFFIEIQLIEMEEQKEINRRLIKLAERVGGELTIGLDSHYLYPEHGESQDLLMCIRQKRTIQDLEQKDDDTWVFTVKNLFYRNYEQVLELFQNGFVNSRGEKVEKFEDEVFTKQVFRKACLNTRKIAVLADDIKIDTSIKLPKLHENSEEILTQMAWDGFRAKGFDKGEKAGIYKDRLSYELDVICLSGWADYFLITKMIIDKAIELKGEFACGWGRGCFLGDSLVQIENKSAPIKDIQIGDRVYSHDGSLNPVLDKYVYEVDEEMVRLVFEDGRIIECTPDHKILKWQCYGCTEWKPANKLKTGDFVLDCNGHELGIVRSCESFWHKGKVYDLCVENTHTYNIEGLAVHNSAAGSLVSYCVGITYIDPIEYGLLFERFLDFSRSEIKVNSFEVE